LGKSVLEDALELGSRIAQTREYGEMQRTEALLRADAKAIANPKVLRGGSRLSEAHGGY
jgi:hypothetical protein